MAPFPDRSPVREGGRRALCTYAPLRYNLIRRSHLPEGDDVTATTQNPLQTELDAAAGLLAESPTPVDSAIVLDFGSQTAQLIVRRVREARVYCELVPHDVDRGVLERLRPKGIILSGGPASVFAPGAPQLPEWV